MDICCPINQPYQTQGGKKMDKRLDHALILGSSSGFGAAACRELAKNGLHIVGVHLRRRNEQAEVETEVTACGMKFLSLGRVNAADADARARAIETMQKAMEGSAFKIVLHSIAFGSTVPYIGEKAVSQKQMDMTLDVMANSLVYWAQDLLDNELIVAGSRVLVMTSSGSQRVVQNYEPVSAAKAALESHVRQLALEMGQHGINVNAIRAGVTDTPALRRIPGYEELIQTATVRNPRGRITTTEDIARFLALFNTSGMDWVNGTVLTVDGGEEIIG